MIRSVTLTSPIVLGPSKPHRAGRGLELLLAPLAFGAGFAKAAGQHDRGRSTGLRQLAHRIHDPVGAEQDKSDIGRLGQRAHVGIAGQAGDVPGSAD